MDIQAQTMTKKEIKLYHHYKNFKKHYPHRDIKLAVNIIIILALNSELSSKAIRIKLSSIGGGHTHKSIQTALERLNEIGYVIKYSILHKSQTDNMWKLSCVGNLVSLIILKDDEFYSFINQHKEEKFYKMIDVLTKSHKNDFVMLLINKLDENDQLKIEKIALDWYNDMRLIISNMNTSGYPKLKTLQEKINRDGFDPIMLSKRGFIIDPMFSETRLDRIC